MISILLAFVWPGAQRLYKLSNQVQTLSEFESADRVRPADDGRLCEKPLNLDLHPPGGPASPPPLLSPLRVLQSLLPGLHGDSRSCDTWSFSTSCRILLLCLQSICDFVILMVQTVILLCWFILLRWHPLPVCPSWWSVPPLFLCLTFLKVFVSDPGSEDRGGRMLYMLWTELIILTLLLNIIIKYYAVTWRCSSWKFFTLISLILDQHSSWED